MDILACDIKVGDIIEPTWDSWRNFEAFTVASVSEIRRADGTEFIRYIDTNGIDGSVKKFHHCKLVGRA